MENRFYPTIPAALYIPRSIWPYIFLKRDIDADEVPESVQALLDTDEFDAAVREEIDLDEFIEKYPQYGHLDELIPYDYFDVYALSDFVEESGVDCRFFEDTDVEIETVEPDKVANPVRTDFDTGKDLDDNHTMYLLPEKEASPFHTAYATIDELVQEFEKRILPILPETHMPADFDCRTYLCKFKITYMEVCL